MEQPETGHDEPHTPHGGQRLPRFAPTQQLLPLQVAPMGQTAVSWQTCGQTAGMLETQVLLEVEQTVLSAQSVSTEQPGWQRGWVGSLLQLAASGQSVFVTQPARQLFDPSGFGSQI